MPQTIKLGSTGSDVSTWQAMLTSAGYSTPATGTFDATTEANTKTWQSAKGLTPDGIVGPLSWGKMTGNASPAPSGGSDPNAAYGRAALLEAWPLVTGEQPSLAELQFVGANARLESGYGKAPYKLLDHATGQVLKSSGVIHNFGAVQGGSEADGTGFLATDTSPLKATADNPKGYYDHHYRIFPSAAAGAAEMVKQMTVRRPTAWALIKTGDIDAACAQLHAGIDASGHLKKDPETGVPGYFEQNPAQRAKMIAKYAADIAATLGEPLAAAQGGPVAQDSALAPGGDGAPLSPAKKGLAAAALALAAALAWWWFR